MAEQAIELKNKGNTAFQNKDYDIAVDYFTKAIQLDPTNHVLYSNRSAAYSQMSKFEEALQDADKCIELNKAFVKGYTRRGAALFGLKRYDDARAAYNDGLAIDPNNVACKEGLESIPTPGMDENPVQALSEMFKNAPEVVRTHPKLKQYADDPEFMQKVENLSKNPQSFATSLSDPRMSQLLAALLNIPEDTYQQAAAAAQSQQPFGQNPYSYEPPTYTPPTSSSSSSSSSTTSTSQPAPKPVVDPNSPAVRAKAMKDQGNTLYKKKQFEQALVCYDRARSIDPTDPTFLLNMAAAWMELGNAAERDADELQKEAAAGTAVSLSSVSLPSRLARAMHLLHAEQTERAAKKQQERAEKKEQAAAAAAAAKALKEEEKEYVTKEAQDGTIMADDDEEEEHKEVEAEKPAEEEKAEEPAEEEEPEEEEEIVPDVQLEDEAQLHQMTSEQLQAKKKEEQAELYKQAMAVCEKALAVAQANNSSYQVKGKIYLRMSTIETKRVNYDKAMEYMRQSLMEHRTDEAVRKERELKQLIEKKKELDYLDPQKAEEAREKGNDEYMKGNFAEAIKLYTESIKRNPKNARVYSNRATCYSKLMNWSSALDDCDKAIQLDPTFIKPYIRKGNIQTYLKQYPQAMRTFEAALQIDPTNSDALQGNQELMMRIQQSQTGDGPDEQQIAEAMKDPEIRAILQDPVMNNVLQDMQSNPARAQQHLQNPKIAQGIAKLMAAGIIKTR